MATKIVLNRKSEVLNRARAFKVFIDGEEKGAIKNGGAEEYPVSPGTHTVQCKIRWYSSPEMTVNLQEGETKVLKVQAAMKYFMVAYILLLIVIVSDLLIRKAGATVNPSWAWIKLVLVGIFAIYFLYFGLLRPKKYLLLEEDKNSVFS